MLRGDVASQESLPCQEELTNLEGGFVITNLGPEESSESENL